MDPNVWGPHAWIFLHSITLSYPECPTEKDKDNIKNFFNNLQHVLPCGSCRTHFNNNIKKYPLTDKILCSKEAVVKWLVDIHNEVNILNNKSTITYNDFLYKYVLMYDNSNKTNLYTIIAFIFLILIIIVITFIMYRK